MDWTGVGTLVAGAGATKDHHRDVDRPTTASPRPDADALLEGVGAARLLGWASIVAVLCGVAAGLDVRNAPAIVVLTVAGAVGHAAFSSLPWERLLAGPRGRLLLDLWSGGLLVAVCGLVLVAGARSRLDLLLFPVLPFLAITHDGPWLWRWLASATAAYVATMGLAPDRLDLAEALLHLVLLAAATALGLRLARAVRRQASARREAIARAELEGAMLAEAHHRVKNSLQVVADLLLLGRPEAASDGVGEAFDHATARIRAIAAVHDALADRSGGRVEAGELLRRVAAAGAAPGDVAIDAADVRLNAHQAQQLGIVVNELVTNAEQHGAPPVAVALRDGHGELALDLHDAGAGPSAAAWAAPGLGLQLVKQVVQQGLRGEIERTEDGHVHVRFHVEVADDAHPGR